MERGRRDIDALQQIIDGVNNTLNELRQDINSTDPKRRERAAQEIQGVVAAALNIYPAPETSRRAGRRKHHFDK